MTDLHPIKRKAKATYKVQKKYIIKILNITVEITINRTKTLKN